MMSAGRDVCLEGSATEIRARARTTRAKTKMTIYGVLSLKEVEGPHAESWLES